MPETVVRVEPLWAGPAARPDEVSAEECRARAQLFRLLAGAFAEEPARDYLQALRHLNYADRHAISHVLNDVVREHARRVHVFLGLGGAHRDFLPVDVPQLERVLQLREELLLCRVE